MQLNAPQVPSKSAKDLIFEPCTLSVDVLNLKSSDDCTRVFENDKVLNEYVVGIDFEWKPPNTERKQEAGKVSVVQIATRSKVYVVQLLLCDSFPVSVRDILESQSVIKVCVGVANDALKLHRDWGVKCSSCINVQRVFRDIGPVIKGVSSRNYSSLAAMCLKLFNLKVDKTLARSDWSLAELSEDQIRYAATDAMLSRQIFVALADRSVWNVSAPTFVEKFLETIKYKRKQLEQQVSSSHPKKLSGESTNSETFGNPSLKASSSSHSNSSSNSQTHVDRASYKARRFQNYAKMASRKSDLYDNIRLEAPDGQLLAMIPEKKLTWYESRGLANIVVEEGKPPVVRLKFEPRGRTHTDDMYYLSNKENKCVSCGQEKNLLRHYVVPHEYRQHFPLEFKIRSSHDIVLLCVVCNSTVSSAQARLRKVLNLQYNVENSPKFIRDIEQESVGKAAWAILKSASRIPKDRRIQLWEMVYTFLNDNKTVKASLLDLPETDVDRILFEIDEQVRKEECTIPQSAIQVLQAVAKRETLKPNKNYRPSSEQVIESLLQQADSSSCTESGNESQLVAARRDHVQQFVERWRQVFVDVLQPKYLPKGWCVDFMVECNTKHSLDTRQVQLEVSEKTC